MKSQIFLDYNLKLPSEEDFEIVEVKGAGHPDTLADDLAEELSCNYSLYTKKDLAQYYIITLIKWDY